MVAPSALEVIAVNKAMNRHDDVVIVGAGTISLVPAFAAVMLAADGGVQGVPWLGASLAALTTAPVLLDRVMSYRRPPATD
ncbi:hypothetical protein [Nonomuraea monospora]|uniref:hypothetical protein n=1 Tax=Nonomuraea monospora TaxID=568818 RepID=UPI0031CE042A